jgi:hypothetical protein
MLKTLIITFLSSFLALTGCVNEPPRRDFEAGKKVQTIAVTEDAHLFAQKDILLEQKSLTSQLSKMDLNWKAELDKASIYHSIAVTGLITQLASLAVCVAQKSTANVIGWCGGSIVVGLLSIPFERKSQRASYRVVDQYNRSLPSK